MLKTKTKTKISLTLIMKGRILKQYKFTLSTFFCLIAFLAVVVAVAATSCIEIFARRHTARN